MLKKRADLHKRVSQFISIFAVVTAILTAVLFFGPSKTAAHDNPQPAIFGAASSSSRVIVFPDTGNQPNTRIPVPGLPANTKPHGVAYTGNETADAVATVTANIACPPGQKVWDGGGSSNNWSEASNWCDDTLPVATSNVVFNATSTKDAVMDVNVSVQGFLIEAGYTGTISQGSSNLSVGSGNYSQAAGTFTGGTGSMTFTNLFTLSGGTFTASSTTTSFAFSFTQTGGTFNHNNGTVVFDSSNSATYDVVSSLTFNNVTINKPGIAQLSISTGDTLLAVGTVTLQSGTLAGAGSLEARGGVIVSNVFAGGFGNLFIAGPDARTITIPTGAALPNLRVNAANVTMNTVGSGLISLRAVVLDDVLSWTNGAADFDLVAGSNWTQNGGTFIGGSGSITFRQLVTHNGGTFTGGSGPITLTNSTFTLAGGTFTASSTTTSFAFSFTQTGGTFNHNNGTVVFDSSNSATYDVVSSLTFNNVTINKPGIAQLSISTGDTLLAVGTVTLQSGTLAGAGSLEARGGVIVSNVFAGGFGNLFIAGPDARTITIPTGAALPNLRVNAANVTMNTVGSGLISLRAVVLDDVLSWTNGAADFDLVAGSNWTQNGGTFIGGSGSITFRQLVTHNGGTFTGGSGPITLTNSTFTLAGGTFTASSTTTSFAFSFTQTGGTFNHNNGTVVFDSSNSATYDVVSSLTFNNVTINKPGIAQLSISTGDTLLAVGTVTLQSGTLTGAGSLEARGGVIVSNVFAGGFGNLRFGGDAIQTFINNGGVNPTNVWTIDKTGGTVQLLSDLNISNGGASAFNLTNGTITTNGFLVNAGTRVVNRTNGYVNGRLRRTINSVASRVFHVGTDNGFSPVTANVTALGVNPSALTIGAVQGQHPNRPVTGSALGRYWTITEEGDVTAILTFHYLEADLFGVQESSFTLERYTGVGTIFDTIPATQDTIANTYTTNSGITEFSDWTMLSPLGPTSAGVSVGGRVELPNGRGIARARLELTDLEGTVSPAVTNQFGYFAFQGVRSGETYVLSVSHRSYQFADPTRVITVDDDIIGIVFTALDGKTTGALGDIEGRIMGPRGISLSGVEIELIGGDLPNPVIAVSDKDGRFTFGGLRIGSTYILTVHSNRVITEGPIRVIVLDSDLVTVEFEIEGDADRQPHLPPK